MNPLLLTNSRYLREIFHKIGPAFDFGTKCKILYQFASWSKYYTSPDSYTPLTLWSLEGDMHITCLGSITELHKPLLLIFPKSLKKIHP